jgi:XTP/dITP diphosphohydrolase
MGHVISDLTIATFNNGKLNEYRTMLEGIRLNVRDLSDFPGIPDVEETADTFVGNAVLKAVGYAKATGSITLADDSGLEVAALGGRPGVLSARYGGENTSFDEKMSLLLNEIAKTGSGDRRARFVCEAAIADAQGVIRFTARGECPGTISAEPRGKRGFGYDPLFIPHGLELTFGELPDDVKHQISHRAMAFAQIIPYLRDNTAV